MSAERNPLTTTYVTRLPGGGISWLYVICRDCQKIQGAAHQDHRGDMEQLKTRACFDCEGRTYDPDRNNFAAPRLLDYR